MSSNKHRNGNSPVRTVSKVFIYAVELVVLIFCGTASYHFGMELFSGEGVEEYPGQVRTIVFEEGTSMKEASKILEEYGVVKDKTVFYVQSIIYDLDSVTPGAYDFNTSDSGDKIISTISAGPNEQQEDPVTE